MLTNVHVVEVACLQAKDAEAFRSLIAGWRNGDVLIMLRQCAWCLRLIDLAGERVSTQPLPKLYEASHGMCSVCGTLWIEQVSYPLSEEQEAIVKDQVPHS